MALPACGRVDGKQSDVRTVVTLDHGHHTGRHVTEDGGRLLGCEERTLELLGRRRIGEGALAQRSDAFEIRQLQLVDWLTVAALSAEPDELQLTSSGKRRRASCVACATTWPVESHSVVVSSTMPPVTTCAVIRMPTQPGAGSART